MPLCASRGPLLLRGRSLLSTMSPVVTKRIELVKEPKPDKPSGTRCVLEDSEMYAYLDRFPWVNLKLKKIPACLHLGLT